MQTWVEVIQQFWFLQIYLDWTWFSMVAQYSTIAWTRWMALYRPHSFRTQTPLFSYTLSFFCYVLALVMVRLEELRIRWKRLNFQVLSTHFQAWYVTFYYEPSNYGMLAEDFPLYLTGGQSAMFLIFHLCGIVLPIIFYT